MASYLSGASNMKIGHADMSQNHHHYPPQNNIVLAGTYAPGAVHQQAIVSGGTASFAAPVIPRRRARDAPSLPRKSASERLRDHLEALGAYDPPSHFYPQGPQTQAPPTYPNFNPPAADTRAQQQEPTKSSNFPLQVPHAQAPPTYSYSNYSPPAPATRQQQQEPMKPSNFPPQVPQAHTPPRYSYSSYSAPAPSPHAQQPEPVQPEIPPAPHAASSSAGFASALPTYPISPPTLHMQQPEPTRPEFSPTTSSAESASSAPVPSNIIPPNTFRNESPPRPHPIPIQTKEPQSVSAQTKNPKPILIRKEEPEEDDDLLQAPQTPPILATVLDNAVATPTALEADERPELISPNASSSPVKGSSRKKRVFKILGFKLSL